MGLANQPKVDESANANGTNNTDADKRKQVNNKSSRRTSSVRFGTVSVLEFGMTLDANPAAASGLAVTMEPKPHSRRPEVSVDEFESSKKAAQLEDVAAAAEEEGTFYKIVTEESEYLPLPSSALVMSYYEIKAILLRAGYTKREIKESGKQVRAERLDRCRSSFENHDGNKSMLRMAGFTDEEIKKTGKKIRAENIKRKFHGSCQSPISMMHPMMHLKSFTRFPFGSSIRNNNRVVLPQKKLLQAS